MGVRISVTHCYLEFGGEEHAYHLYLIFPYFLRLVVQIGGVNLFYLLEDEQSLSMGEFDRAYSAYIIL